MRRGTPPETRPVIQKLDFLARRGLEPFGAASRRSPAEPLEVFAFVHIGRPFLVVFRARVSPNAPTPNLALAATPLGGLGGLDTRQVRRQAPVAILAVALEEHALGLWRAVEDAALTVLVGAAHPDRVVAQGVEAHEDAVGPVEVRPGPILGVCGGGTAVTRSGKVPVVSPNTPASDLFPAISH